jgi:DinB superfamily
MLRAIRNEGRERMKKILVGCLGLALMAVTAGAQTPAPETSKNPVTDMMRQMLERSAKNTIEAAQEMPADKYGYKPTPEQITYGHLIVHIINANNTICSKYGGITLPAAEKPADTDPKDKLVPQVKAAFDVCTQAFAKADDSNLGESIKVFGDRPLTRGAVLLIMASELADHYGMQAMYLRLNNLLPPTAKKDK